MSSDSERLLPPCEPAAFESLCLDLWKDIWGDSGAQKNGRSGQPQAGVDVFGSTQGEWVGVQCKQKDGLLRTKLTHVELEDEVRKALNFTPPLKVFILATSGPRDARVQERARLLTEEHSRQGVFKVEVWSWDDIWHELYQRDALLNRIKAVYWPRLTASDAPAEISPTRLRVTGRTFCGRAKELRMLDDAWDSVSAEKINIVSLIGQGGEGKTALILEWYARRVRQGWPGVRRVYDWSFYSQGANAQSAASADEFFHKTLAWFGHTGEFPRDPWTRGEKLAQLIAAERTLLVLDGLEPLQQPPGDYGGEFKDPAMGALLRKLALQNPGLCVLTSRTDVADLKDFEHAGGPCLRHPLHKLDVAAARQLLRDLGMRGPDRDVDESIVWFKGHAYNLNLLGNYLAQCTPDHEIRRWKETLLLNEDEHVHGQSRASGQKEGHGRRMLRAYERWLGPHTPAVAILRLLGLFDRPARSDLLNELRAAPVIPGLTETLVGLPEDEWLRVIGQLEQLRLIVRERLAERLSDEASSRSKPKRVARSVSYAIDSHPLLREHFAAELRITDEDAWRTAHGRLYQYLRDSTPDRPHPTLQELQPLYQSVTHGCKAGLTEETRTSVFYDRIRQGGAAYSWRKLGAFGSDLGAASCFFKQPWSELLPGITEMGQGWLLNEVSFCLTAMGRLTEAVEPLSRAVEMGVEQTAWKAAAARAMNLSHVRLLLGDIAAAVHDARRCVAHADTCGDAFERECARCMLADALHQQGLKDAAHELFVEAEANRIDRDSEYPLIYSLAGVQYCDFLLAAPERAAWRLFLEPETSISVQEMVACCNAVERRATTTLKWSKAFGPASLLDCALNHVTLCRAALCRTQVESCNTSAQSTAVLRTEDGHGPSSVDRLGSSREQLVFAFADLRSASAQDAIAGGLLTRAWLRFLEGDIASARADLDEAWEIAERGPMRLHMADIHLHRARLFRDRDELMKARAMIEQCGYWRRKEELEDAEEAAKNWS